MENIISNRIQIISIIISFLFLFNIGRLIVKRKLREEYSIIWIIATITLIVFSFWTDGLIIISNIVGIRVASNLIFTGAIFIILVYLLHLSTVASQLHEENKKISQEIALMKKKLEEKSPNKYDKDER